MPWTPGITVTYELLSETDAGIGSTEFEVRSFIGGDTTFGLRVYASLYEFFPGSPDAYLTSRAGIAIGYPLAKTDSVEVVVHKGEPPLTLSHDPPVDAPLAHSYFGQKVMQTWRSVHTNVNATGLIKRVVTRVFTISGFACNLSGSVPYGSPGGQQIPQAIDIVVRTEASIVLTRDPLYDYYLLAPPYATIICQFYQDGYSTYSLHPYGYAEEKGFIFHGEGLNPLAGDAWYQQHVDPITRTHRFGWPPPSISTISSVLNIYRWAASCALHDTTGRIHFFTVSTDGTELLDYTFDYQDESPVSNTIASASGGIAAPSFWVHETFLEGVALLVETGSPRLFRNFKHGKEEWVAAIIPGNYVELAATLDRTRIVLLGFKSSDNKWYCKVGSILSDGNYSWSGENLVATTNPNGMGVLTTHPRTSDLEFIYQDTSDVWHLIKCRGLASDGTGTWA